MPMSSGTFVPISVLPLREDETWAWNSANSEVTSLSLSWLVLPHPAAMTALVSSRARKVPVLLERKFKFRHLDILFKDIRGYPGVCRNIPTWESLFHYVITFNLLTYLLSIQYRMYRLPIVCTAL